MDFLPGYKIVEENEEVDENAVHIEYYNRIAEAYEQAADAYDKIAMQYDELPEEIPTRTQKRHNALSNVLEEVNQTQKEIAVLKSELNSARAQFTDYAVRTNPNGDIDFIRQEGGENPRWRELLKEEVPQVYSATYSSATAFATQSYISFTTPVGSFTEFVHPKLGVS